MKSIYATRTAPSSLAEQRAQFWKSSYTNMENEKEEYYTKYYQTLAANSDLVAKLKELRAQARGTTETAARIAHLERQLANADATLSRALATNKELSNELNQAMGHLMEVTLQGLKDNAALDTAIKTLHHYMCFFHTASISQPPSALQDTVPYKHPMRREEN